MKFKEWVKSNMAYNVALATKKINILKYFVLYKK